jgi:hypothetical protein
MRALDTAAAVRSVGAAGAARPQATSVRPTASHASVVESRSCDPGPYSASAAASVPKRASHMVASSARAVNAVKKIRSAAARPTAVTTGPVCPWFWASPALLPPLTAR